jgi:hypothetical protein
MAEATTTLASGAIKVEALRLARNAVKLDIRDRGDKLSNWAMKDINALAEQRWQEFLSEATRTMLRVEELAQYRRVGSVCNPTKFRTLRNLQASKAKEFSR